MPCPHCHSPHAKVRKHGVFTRFFSGKAHTIPRFRCTCCQKTFSAQTGTLTYRERRSDVNKPLFLLLCSGISQRRCALLSSVNRKTVAKKLVRMGAFAGRHLHETVAEDVLQDTVIFDEMETFEHSKCKPLAIAVAVEAGSRRIIAAEVASMPAKGKLAAISRRRYGYRADHRRRALQRVLAEIARANPHVICIRSDQCPRYPPLVRAAFPHVTHETFKGRRGCVVGQGELKAGGFDPLFALNHTCAMFRDNLKTLARRTWCTVKRPERLQALVNLYAVFHNARLKKACPITMIDSASTDLLPDR